MKLKPLLEGYAWERKPGKGLPTLAEVEAQHRKNLTEDETDFLTSIDALSTACKQAQTALDSAVRSLDFGTSEDAATAEKALTQNVNTVMDTLCMYIDGIKKLYIEYPNQPLEDYVTDGTDIFKIKTDSDNNGNIPDGNNTNTGNLNFY